MKTVVKIIYAENYDTFEGQINSFLHLLPEDKLVDIKIIQGNSTHTTTAMIIYYK